MGGETLPKAPVPRILSVAPKILKPADVIRWLKLLVYGDTGAGKTVLLGSVADVPDMCPVIYCDLELGTLSIRGADVDLVTGNTINDLLNTLNYVRANPGKYNTVVIDTITEAYTLQMEQRLKHAVLKDPSHDPYVPEMQDWLHATMRIRALLRTIRAMACHVLVAATPVIVADELVGDILKLYPDLPGKLAPEVGKYFDIVGYLHTKLIGPAKLIRELQCQPFNRRVAKDRSDRLGMVLSEPTMEKIHSLAIGAKVAPEVGPEPTEEPIVTEEVSE